MKKLLFLSMALILALTFCACSNNSSTTQTSNDKEGVTPYVFTEQETNLLQSLGLEREVNIVDFKAPKEAKSLLVEIFTRNAQGDWEPIGGGQISLGEDAPEHVLEGTFAMILKDNYAMDFHITTLGQASYQIDEQEVPFDIIGSTKCFLTSHQAIKINEKIPVAIMVYDSGTSMSSYTTENFYTPQDFEGMDYVQAVTLTFLDETQTSNAS